ncbi:hypothetical protein [Amycolatopsis anabasis]|uniref:hypothetical protein n=1 Tax=Amycolatopsis anabasis TaxID=1840409 RepID=UPI00131D124A|nr:hypothetical protein [Amycolatopsis anabasis]
MRRRIAAIAATAGIALSLSLGTAHAEDSTNAVEPVSYHQWFPTLWDCLNWLGRTQNELRAQGYTNFPMANCAGWIPSYGTIEAS